MNRSLTHGFGRRFLLAAIVIAATLAGAAPLVGQRAGVRDSAGVKIVEFRVPKTIPIWRLDTNAIIEIGGQQDPHYELNPDWGLGFTLLSDGMFCISDSPEIRVFDSTGRYLRSMGRDGDGPGEFRNHSFMDAYRGDSIIGWDFMKRVSVFDRNGRVGRAFRLPFLPGYRGKDLIRNESHSHVVGSLDDGTIIEIGMEEVSLAKTGLYWSIVPINYYAPDGKLKAAITGLKGIEIVRGPSVLKGAFAAHPYLQPNFARGPQWAGTYQNLVYLAHSEHLGFTVYDSDAKLVMVVRSVDRPPAPTDAEKDLYAADMLGSAAAVAANKRGEGSKGMTEQMVDLPYPPHKPAFGSMIVDGGGNAWFSDFYPRFRDHKTRPTAWTVISRDGEVIGRLATPPGARLVAVDHDMVVLRTEDEDDVVHVRMVRLLRDAGPGPKR